MAKVKLIFSVECFKNKINKINDIIANKEKCDTLYSNVIVEDFENYKVYADNNFKNITDLCLKYVIADKVKYLKRLNNRQMLIIFKNNNIFLVTFLYTQFLFK